MQPFVRFGITGFCFLAFAVALGTLAPVSDIVSEVEDSPANPWITVEITNGQVSYVLPSGIGVSAADDRDARLIVPGELKADWKAPRSSGANTATFDNVEAPSLMDESFDLNADGEINSSADMLADYAVGFGGTSGGLYAGTSGVASVQKAVPDMMGAHRGWNRRPPLSSDSKETCSPFKELCPNTVGVAPTPEPNGIALLGMGLIALAIGSRRRVFT